MATLITDRWLKNRRACAEARKQFRKLFPDGTEISSSSLNKFRMSDESAIYWLEWLEDALYNKVSSIATKGLYHDSIGVECEACEALRLRFKGLPRSITGRILFYAKYLNMI